MSQRVLKDFVLFGRKIVGVGANYRVAGSTQSSQQPLTFSKPPSSYITQGQKIKIPECFKNDEIFHEIELGVIIGRTASNINPSEYRDYIGGYVLALDMTNRSFIDNSKKHGQGPWYLGKSFDTSCAVGDFIARDLIADPHDLTLTMTLNGRLVHDGHTGDMICDIPHLMQYWSRTMTLERGDLLLTGTPPGAGAVKAGDVIKGSLGDVANITFEVE